MNPLEAPSSDPLDLTGWPGTGSRAGSLYAVPAPDRIAAARQLAAAGWWVHVDVMVAPAGTSGGVGLDELAAVRAELPGARVEVHVIDLGGDLDPVLAQVLRARPDRVVLPPAHCDRRRVGGVELWAERDRRPLPTGLDVDGVLVMLIDPGTTQPIDLDRLAAVADVPAGLAVGVDGGVGPGHAGVCARAGVGHLVSGRALLSQHQPQLTEESRR